ncbi:hypothetical protein MATL_G00102750 [Megalops atlanticus]|uniref:C2H2-type domain-containing protein n=1 Tax=Megalops atlanticus TaxID=7932 RepID=A0A9D3Q3S1_MEGAT|nr:hypothetical protein MATL_G00102750 [Megalops atlanticus]
MNADDCNGRSYVSGSGDSSMEREFSGGLGGPTVSTPNSQHSSPSHSLSANSIKVELYSDDEPGCVSLLRRGEERGEGWKDERGERAEDGGPEVGGGGCGGSSSGGGCGGEGAGHGEWASPKPASPGPIRLPNGKLKCDVCGMICIGPNVLMVHKRSHTGERPFKCNQCGASFTQKGNLLRHIKLHSGEKPFKCPFCAYACRRRDALTGHLRTHSVSSPIVGKPYKCSYCGRSYKQQSTLEEHRERCHSYLQSLEPHPSQGAHTKGNAQGEDSRDLEFTPDPLQPIFMDRLTNSVTKRKRSTPQKFVGEKHICLSMADTPLEKEGDMIGSQHMGVDSSHYVGVGGEYLRGPGGGPEPVRPLRLPPPHATCLSEFTPVISSIYNQLATPGPRADCVGGGAGVGGVALGLGGREAGEGHEDWPPGRSHTASPSNGCHDSTDNESVAEEQCPIAAPASSANHHPTVALQRGRDRHSPAHTKERDRGEREREEGGQLQAPAAAPPQGSGSPGPREALRVVDGEGRPMRSFHCEHCRVLFLDHVMFTIHMGCHGFRQPLECNICGHRSQDRYEFSSHIVRGEHKVG